MSQYLHVLRSRVGDVVSDIILQERVNTLLLRVTSVNDKSNIANVRFVTPSVLTSLKKAIALLGSKPSWGSHFEILTSLKSRMQADALLGN